MGVRDTGKVQNWTVAKSQIVLVLVLDKTFALVDSKFHFQSSTNELRLLISSAFSGKQELTERRFLLHGL